MSKSSSADNELEISFNNILEEIRNKILKKDVHIVQELNYLLEKANEKEKKKMLEQLNSEFQMNSFMLMGNYLTSNSHTEIQQAPKDYRLMYNNAKSEQNFQQILKILQNFERVEFLTQNNFPQIIGNHTMIFKHIGKKMFNLLDFLLEIQQIGSSQFKLLRKLLKYIYCSKLNQTDQISLEQIIGSKMMNQLYELQVYIAGVKNQSPKDFDQLILKIQNQQMFGNQDNPKFENEKILFLSILLTQNLNKEILRQNLDVLIQKTLNINDELINFAKINQALYQLIDQKINLQECFISVTLYYCLQYASRFGLNCKIHKLKEKNSQIQKLERKQELYHRFLKDSWDQNDEIYVHIVNRCVYFNPKIEEFIDLENYKKYLNNKRNMQSKKILQYKSLKSLLKLSKEQFQEYWIQLKTLNYNDLQEFNKHDNSLNQKFTIFLWMTDQDQIYPVLIKLFSDDSSSILQCISKNIKDCQMFSKFTLVNLFTIVCEYRNFQMKDLETLSKSLIIYDSIKIAMMLLRYQEISIQTNLSSKDIQLLAEQKLIHWILIKQFFATNLHTQIIEIIVNHYQSTKSAELYLKLYLIQRIMSPNKIEIQVYKYLIQNIDTNLLYLIFKFNQSKKILNFPQLKIILCTIYALHDKLKLQKKQQFVFENLNILFDFSFVNFKQLHISIADGISWALIHKMIKACYFNFVKNIEKLKILCFEIHREDKQHYEKWFSQFNYFDILSLSPMFLRRLQVHQLYPINLNITLEKFNIYMAEQAKEQQFDLVKQWKQENSSSKFKELIPFFLNIIKREQNANQLLSLIDAKASQSELYNMKALFQILFNNSNQELQFVLLKFRSPLPVPFIYQNPHCSSIQKEEDLYQLNHQLYYVFLDSFTIINFSLSKNNSQYGKTQLINQIFFQMDKFETCDTCEINQNTIDIIFDYSFNNSRNFSIADIHGQMPSSILEKVLPLFKLWIIQINKEEELEENFQQLQRLTPIIELNQPKICFIVRNVQIKQEQRNIVLNFGNIKININIHFALDLTKRGLDKEIQLQEIDNIQKFVFFQIGKAGYPSSQNQNSEDFLNIVENFNKECKLISNEIKEGNQIIQSILKNLKKFIDSPEGFLNQNSFPMRGIDFKIKTLTEKLRNNLQKDQQKQEIVLNLKQEIEKLQHSRTQQKSTEILMQFCSLFDRQNYYVLYLWLTDKVRKLNEEKAYQLQKQNQKLNQDMQHLKQQKKKNQIKYSEDPKIIQQRINKLQTLLQENLTKIQLTYIGIEIFWREIIQQKYECSMTDLKIDPVKMIFEMLQKGESFEFFDENFQINLKFLNQIVGNFLSQDNEKAQYQELPTLISNKFNNLWADIITKLHSQQQILFDEFQLHQYQSITQAFTQYTLKSSHDQEYYIFLKENMNKQNPKDNHDEQLAFFQVFNQELQQIQFMAIDNRNQKNVRYLDIFHSPITSRLQESSPDELISMSEHYYYNISWKVIGINQFKSYFSESIFADLQPLLPICRDKKNFIQIKNFLYIFLTFGIKYNKENFYRLIDLIQRPKVWQITQGLKDSVVKEALLTLTQTLEFTLQEGKIFFEKEDSYYEFTKTYPSLKIGTIENKYLLESQWIQERQSLSQQYFILQEKKVVKARDETNLHFHYIAYPMQPQLQQYFQSNFPLCFNQIMQQSKGWERLYTEIYNIIKCEMIGEQKLMKQKNPSQQDQSDPENSNDDDHVTYSNYIIKIILDQIQKKIDCLNNQFSKYGVILRDLGERCIYYFSILIIWRFSCSKKWRLLEKNKQKLQNNQKQQLEKFIADIKKNKVEQSRIKAQTLVNDIWENFIDRFYQDQSPFAIQSLEKKETSSFELIEKLDKEHLNEYLKKKQNGGDQIIEESETLMYIMQQQKYIYNYVNKKIIEFSQEIENNFELKLKNQVKAFLEKIQYNADLLKLQIKEGTVKTRDYFIQENEQKQDEYYEQKLYQIVFRCLQGDTDNPDLDQIEKQYKSYFSGYVKIEQKILTKMQNNSEQEIQLLKSYIDEISLKLGEKLKSIEKIKINLAKLYIQSKLDQIRLQMNGCQETCPMCNRKCDLDNDEHDRHMCKNGHQLRGMNGVLIENQPLLFTCEEIEDDSMIRKMDNNNEERSWREIKQIFPEWSFRSLNTDQIENNKNKMMIVWNEGIGKLICNHLTKQLNTQVHFEIKHNLQSTYKKSESVHQIFKLDDSGSMHSKSLFRQQL